MDTTSVSTTFSFFQKTKCTLGYGILLDFQTYQRTQLMLHIIIEAHYNFLHQARLKTAEPSKQSLLILNFFQHSITDIGFSANA